jgi:hypothetical protein
MAVGWGASLLGRVLLGAGSSRKGTIIYSGIITRIVPQPFNPPPVIDTLVDAIAQRLDWTQQAIQVMGIMNKIEYAHGTDLDDVWGILYTCSRYTSETDIHYRLRLQTRVSILGGSGTIPNSIPILNSLLGIKEGTAIESRWPAMAILTFSSIDAMRAARDRLALLNNVLPDLFAAGVTYSIELPFVDCRLKAAILGYREMERGLYAAIQGTPELTVGLDTLICSLHEETLGVNATIQRTAVLTQLLKAAISGTRLAEVELATAIWGNPYEEVELRAAIESHLALESPMKAAILGSVLSESGFNAAISRTFESRSAILAFVMNMIEVEVGIYATVQATKTLTTGIKARIARSI